MFRVLIVGESGEQVRDVGLGLAEKGFLCSIAGAGGGRCQDDGRREDDDHRESDGCLKEAGGLIDAGRLHADLVVVAISGAAPGSEVRDLARRIKEKTRLPVVALLSGNSLDLLDSGVEVDDFVLEPWKPEEVVARVRRILQRAPGAAREDLLKCGDIVIDPAKCEVACRGRLVDLTFKEYELLKFLAANKGRVFSREALLSSVWGYDYFGGDRTVDVHIRRLRSKLDETEYIETVRNIGYRLRDDT